MLKEIHLDVPQFCYNLCLDKLDTNVVRFVVISDLFRFNMFKRIMMENVLR